MTKILILTHKYDRHFYFVNKILEKYNNNTKVFLNCKTKNETFYEKIKRKFNYKFKLKNIILNLLFYHYGMKFIKEKEFVEKKYFKNQKKLFYSKYKKNILGKVEKSDKSLNDYNCTKKIIGYKADLILVMGTCLIEETIINSAKYIINIHTGLSPYYRGGYSNLWPFLNYDFNFFGVTVHKLTSGIDAGDIIYSKNIENKNNYSFAELNSIAITKGTELMIKAIEKFIEGNLKSIPQWEKGKIYNSYNYNSYTAFKYYRIFKNKLKKSKNSPLIISNGEIC